MSGSNVSIQFLFSGTEHLRLFLKSVFSFLLRSLSMCLFEKPSLVISSCSRHSQTVRDPNWDMKDRWLGVPLQYIPRGKRDAPCRYAAKEPAEKKEL